MSPRAVQYLRSRLAKPPDGRHDPRTFFGAGLSLERIQSCIYSADWGNPRMLTDLSREMLSLDPHLSAVLTKRLGAVASLPLEILPATGPGIDRDRAGFYADVVRAQIDRIPNRKQAIKQLAWGLFDGRAVLEKRWAIAPGSSHPRYGRVTAVVTMLEWIHPRRVFFGPDRELRVVDRPIGIGFTRDGEAFRDYPHKFIEFTPQLFAEYPEREGLARPCLYWCFFKRFAARERMILTELWGKPWRWGEVPADAELTPQEEDDLDTFVEQIAGNGYGRLPRGAELKTLEFSQSTGSEGTIHQEVIKSADDQMSKLVLGQTGTTDSKAQGMGGKQSSVMKDEQEQICFDDASLVEEVLQDFLINDIIHVNFGASAVTHAPRGKLNVDTVDRTKELARLKGALDCGLAVALDEAYEVSGYRKPSDADAVIRIGDPPQLPSGGGDDGTPPKPVLPRPIVAYPVDLVPRPRLQEGETQAVDPLVQVDLPKRGEQPGSGDDAGPVPELPGPLGEDSVVVVSPEEADPTQAGAATASDANSLDAPEPAWGENAGLPQTPHPDEGRGAGVPESTLTTPGVASASDERDVPEEPVIGDRDQYDPNYGYGGVGGTADPEESDRVPRGVMERRSLEALLRRVAAGQHVALAPLPSPAPVVDSTPTPEPGRSPASPEVQPVGLVPEDPELTLPMGPYSDFADCVAKQKAKGHSDESAHAICGSIKKKIEGEVSAALRATGGTCLGRVPETGARRVIHAFGEKVAGEMFLAIQLRRATPAEPSKDVQRQPSTTYGSPEPIVSKATRELAVATSDWAKKLLAAARGKETPSQVYSAIYSASTSLDHDDFARALRRRMLHAEMLGALDSHFERSTDETIKPAKFNKNIWLREILRLAASDEELGALEPATKPTFADISYKPATEFFKKKTVLTPDVFAKLEDGAKARSFTIARTTSRSLLDLVHSELARMVAEGGSVKDFEKFMRERVESAGWTPASPSHIQTIVRTNLMQAYTVGRAVDATQPAVLVDRPYWQIRGVHDDRQRHTHGAVQNWVLRADDPFWHLGLPGAWGYNDRCRFTTLSQKQVEARGLTVRSGSEIKDLPDPGFAGGGLGSLLSVFGAR